MEGQRSAPSNAESVREQYRTAGNLQARSDLHGRFQTNRYGWLRWIFDHFEAGQGWRVLDIGCGNGVLWSFNHARVGADWRATLADLSPGMVEEARGRLAEMPGTFRFVVADAQQIPFADASFDAVVANHMLYHVPGLDRGLREIRRVLRPGAKLYASTNGQDSLRELREMVRPFAPDLPFVRGETAKAFGLESGAGHLGRYFEDVRQDRYEDSLAVTEAEPVIAYVLSVRGAKEALSAEAVDRLQRRIDERIASGGMFRVTKTQGMFVARRDGSAAPSRPFSAAGA